MAGFLRDLARFIAVFLAYWVLATAYVVIYGKGPDAAEVEAIRLIAVLALTKTIWPNFGGW